MDKSNLTKNTIQLSIGILLTNVLQFIMVPLFSSWLSTVDYGIFDLCVTYVSLVLPLINLASGEAIFRFSIDSEIIERKKHISNGLAIVVINSALVSIILITTTFLTGKLILLPFLALLVGQTFHSYCQSFLRGIKRLNIYSVGSIITTVLISLFATVFILLFHWGLYGIILGYALGYFIGNVVIFAISKYWRYFSIHEISKRGIHQLIAYSYPLIPNNISWWVINASDRLVINTFLGAAFNGVYAIAYKIPNVCSSVFGMFNISWQESASTVVHQKDKNLYYSHIYNNTISILISLCAGVVSLNFFFFDYLFDAKYRDARLFMPILIVAIIFSSLAQFYGGIMISMKMPKINGITTLIGAVTNLIVHLALVSFVGLYAAAISTFISNLVLYISRRVFLRNNVKCKIVSINYIYIVFFMYLLLISYFNVPLLIRLFNISSSALLFIYINRRLIRKTIDKVMHNPSIC